VDIKVNRVKLDARALWENRVMKARVARRESVETMVRMAPRGRQGRRVLRVKRAAWVNVAAAVRLEKRGRQDTRVTKVNVVARAPRVRVDLKVRWDPQVNAGAVVTLDLVAAQVQQDPRV